MWGEATGAGPLTARGEGLHGKVAITAQDVETLVKQQPWSGRLGGVPGGGVAMNSVTFDIETVPANAAERARAIRFRLPGQAVMDRIELARVASRPLYTLPPIPQPAAHTLPTPTQS